MNAPTHAAYAQTLGIQARAASTQMARASAATRSACLRHLAQLLRDNTAQLQRRIFDKFRRPEPAFPKHRLQI